MVSGQSVNACSVTHICVTHTVSLNTSYLRVAFEAVVVAVTIRSGWYLVNQIRSRWYLVTQMSSRWYLVNQISSRWYLVTHMRSSGVWSIRSDPDGIWSFGNSMCHTDIIMFPSVVHRHASSRALLLKQLVFTITLV